MSYKVASLEKIVARLEKQNRDLTEVVSGSAGLLPSPANTASLRPDGPPTLSTFSVNPSGNFEHNPVQDVEGHGDMICAASCSPSFPVEAPKADLPPASQIEDIDSEIVSALHMRVSNTVHGPTSAFHPQSYIPSPAGSSNYVELRRQSMSISQQSGSDGCDDELRSRLFLFAASEKQKEHVYGVNGQYDLDGVDYETAMHLLELHWNHQHCAYLTTYRPAILNSLANGGAHASKLLLNAIYFASSLNSDRLCFREDPDDPQSTGNRFLARFNELLIPELEKSSIPNAIALGQVGSSLVACGRQTIGWFYSGLSYRMITDLGLQVDSSKIYKPSSFNTLPDDGLSFIDSEVQRRVFWGSYINDKFQSLYFGRPHTLSATGVEPPNIFLDTYKEMELWAPYVDPENDRPLLRKFVPRPSYVLSTFQRLLRLAQISEKITEHLYMPAVGKMKLLAALDHFNNLRYELEKWQNELPPHLQYDPRKDPAPPAHQFNLHTTYHTLRILLHRPFLPEGHLKHFHVDEQSTRQVCIDAALEIYYLAQAFRDTFTLRRAPYLFSYSVFSAATVVPHDQIASWSDVARNNMIVFFWNALSELQKGSNFGLRRPIKIIRDFMERAGIDIAAIASRPEELPQRQATSNAPTCNFGTRDSDPNGDTRSATILPPSIDSYTVMFPDMLTQNLDWLNYSLDPLNDTDDMLYGLFRSS